MIVVADSSPIHYLIQIQAVGILEGIYGHVLIPPAVREELLHPSAPEPIRQWVSHPPSWLEVRSPTRAPDESLARLDAGERAAIQLAEELAAGQLLMDDREGRQEAERRGLHVLGTLGVLREAAALGILDLRAAVERLQNTNFYIAPEVLARLLDDAG